MEVDSLDDAAGPTSRQTYASTLASKLPQQLCPKLASFTKKIAAPGCMQWSQDGKLLLVFRDAIQIITPALGVNPQIQRTLSFNTEARDPGLNLDCFQTQISIEQDTLPPAGPKAGTIANGELAPLSTTFWSVAWKDAKWSPQKLDRTYSSCIIAALSADLRISLFAPKADPRKGAWRQIQKLDPSEKPKTNIASLVTLAPEGQEAKASLEELDSQISTFDWLPTDSEELGVLVTCSRSGLVCFWRWNIEKECLELAAKTRPTTQSILHVASVRLGTSLQDGYTALACATVDCVYRLLFYIIPSSDLELAHQEELLSKNKVGLIERLCFSPDGRYLAWTTPARIFTVDLHDASRPLSTHRLQRWKTSELAGPDDAPEEENVQRIKLIKRAPWSNAIALLPNVSDGGFTVVLENGQVYNLTKDALKQSQSRTEAERDLLVIENEAGPWKDQRIALASLQRLQAISNSMHSSDRSGNADGEAFLTFALRSDEEVSMLARHGFSCRSSLGLAVSVPPSVNEAQLVNMAEQAISESVDGSSLSAFRPFLLCYLGTKDSKRDVVRSELLSTLERSARFRTDSGLSRCLWLAEWLAVQEKAGHVAGLLGTLRQSAMHRHLNLLLTGEHERHADEVGTESEDAALPAASLGVFELGTAVLRLIEAQSGFLPSILKTAKVRQWKRLAQLPKVYSAEDGKIGLKVGEICPACKRPVALLAFTSSKGYTTMDGICDAGHRWQRCSVTFALMTGARAKQCGTCLARSIFAQDADQPQAKAVLEDQINCPICGGEWLYQ